MNKNNLKYYIYIHQLPQLIVKTSSKKEAVKLIREYFLNKNIICDFYNTNISNYVSSVTDATLIKYVFDTKIEDKDDVVIFNTFKADKRQHIKYYQYKKQTNIDDAKYNGYYQLTNYRIIQMYNCIKRKDKIDKLLKDEEGKKILG